MSEINWLEKQLESWTPREPSQSLKARVFVTKRQAEVVRVESESYRVPMVAWLTPAACLFCVCLFLKGYHTPMLDGVDYAGGSNSMASLQSNLVRYTPPQRDFERQNVWSEVTFEWTKGVASSTSKDSFADGKTNTQKL